MTSKVTCPLHQTTRIKCAVDLITFEASGVGDTVCLNNLVEWDASEGSTQAIMVETHAWREMDELA